MHWSRVNDVLKARLTRESDRRSGQFQRADTIFQRGLRTFAGRRLIVTIEVTMATPSERLLFWSPRILGVLVSGFIGMFALDAFSAGKPVLAAIPDFLRHLIPAFALLAIVIVGFRWPWFGAVGFIGLAIQYAVMWSKGRIDWILAISGPMFVVGVLFLLSVRVARLTRRAG